MQNSKLYSILTQFDKIERNRLRKYLISPYFNKNETLVQLFEVVIGQIDANGAGTLDKAWIWRQIFDDRPFIDVKWRKMCSDLLKLVENFLSQEVYEGEKILQARFLIEAVQEKKLEKLYKGAEKNAKTLSAQQYYKSADYYLTQYQIEEAIFKLRQWHLNRSTKGNIEEISENLDHFYLAEKLRLYTSTSARRKFSAHQYNVQLIDELLMQIKENASKYENIPPIAIYYQIHLTQVDVENEEHYFKLIDLMDKYYPVFPLEEVKEIYTDAINYCIAKINKGNRKFIEEFLDLNEKLLENGILSHGELSPWRFKNIVTVALRAGRIEWTRKFIENYKHFLPESFRENAVIYNYAYLHFYNKNYGKVIQLLQEVEYEDVNYNLDSKAVLISTYYELNEIEPLYSLLESFRVYLNRNLHADPNRPNKLSPQRVKNYKNLIRFVKKLTRLQPNDSTGINKLSEEIKNTKGVPSRRWLMEKIEELN